MTAPNRALLEVIDEAESRRLLNSAVIGRLAYTEDALPAIQPVHFAVHAGRVLIPTQMGSKVTAASRGAVVAFEVDDFDPVSGSGWSVTVVGPSHVVTEPEEVHALDAMGGRPWPPAGLPCYIVIETALVQGRRLVALPQAAELAAAGAGRAR